MATNYDSLNYHIFKIIEDCLILKNLQQLIGVVRKSKSFWFFLPLKNLSYLIEWKLLQKLDQEKENQTFWGWMPQGYSAIYLGDIQQSNPVTTFPDFQV